MVTSAETGTLLSLLQSFLLEPQVHLWLVFSGCSRSEPGSVALLPRVQMLLLTAVWPTEAPSLLSQLTFLNTGLLSKPKSLGESAVCHSSLTDQRRHSEWLFRGKLAGTQFHVCHTGTSQSGVFSGRLRPLRRVAFLMLVKGSEHGPSSYKTLNDDDDG